MEFWLAAGVQGGALDVERRGGAVAREASDGEAGGAVRARVRRVATVHSVGACGRGAVAGGAVVGVVLGL